MSQRPELRHEGEIMSGSYAFTFKTDSPKTKLGFRCIVVRGGRPREDMLSEAEAKLREWETP